MKTYLGLGSNVGDRERNFRFALERLRERGVETVRSASLYLTAPRDFIDQPWFLNTVIETETNLSPSELLAVCLSVEAAAGRIRDRFKGPRPLDIDILLYGTETFNLPGLGIPHPRLFERRFVLAPLAELNSEFQAALDSCPDTGAVQLAGPPLL